MTQTDFLFKGLVFPRTKWYHRILLLFKRSYISRDENFKCVAKRLFGKTHIIKLEED